MRFQKIVRRAQTILQRIFHAGRLLGIAHAAQHALRLVDGDEIFDFFSEALAQKPRVLAEPFRAVGIEPSAPLKQLLGQIPVIEGHIRLYPAAQKLVYKLFVKLRALFVDFSRPGIFSARKRKNDSRLSPVPP